jgi:alcohol dehydrogenase class IV
MPEPAVPAVWSLQRLAQELPEDTVIWATPSVQQTVGETLRWPIVDVAAGFPTDAGAVIVVGGGTLIDHAKRERHTRAPQVRLVAIPSLWGSGAEASPIVVTTHPDHKEVCIDDGFLPDVRVVWPELAQNAPMHLMRYACGDTWSHALEGFVCPLATDDLRLELAGTMHELLTLPIGYDSRWFDVSARACAAQARAGVGLDHGIAHVLEPVLRAAHPGDGWGHARLCSAFLSPVLHLLVSVSDKAQGLVSAYGLDLAAIESAAHSVGSADDYAACLPTLMDCWPRVLRDPCTRTSCVVIRPSYVSYFQ